MRVRCLGPSVAKGLVSSASFAAASSGRASRASPSASTRSTDSSPTAPADRGVAPSASSRSKLPVPPLPAWDCSGRKHGASGRGLSASVTVVPSWSRARPWLPCTDQRRAREQEATRPRPAVSAVPPQEEGREDHHSALVHGATAEGDRLGGGGRRGSNQSLLQRVRRRQRPVRLRLGGQEVRAGR